MAGAKTRFGFHGGSEPPDDEESRSARTVFGHDVHLQLPPGFSDPRPPASPTPPPPPPAWPSATATGAVVPACEAPNATSTERRTRPRPSRLARFLGRWTRSGRFEARSRMRTEVYGEAAGGDLDVPRDTTGRNVLLVVLAALLAFGITFAAVKIRHRLSAPPPALPGQTTVLPAKSTATSPTPPSSPPSIPAAASTTARPATTAPTPAASAAVPAVNAAPAQDPAARGLGVPPPAARRPAAKARQRVEPPAHLKGELLPIGS
jgi:hypothetical protein